MKTNKKRLPFWSVCIFILFCAPLVGGLGGCLGPRLMGEKPKWKVIVLPAGEKVSGILDADFPHRNGYVIVKMESGSIYAWQEQEFPDAMFPPERTPKEKHWWMLPPLPDGRKVKYLMQSPYASIVSNEPSILVKAEDGQGYKWQNMSWQLFDNENDPSNRWGGQNQWPSDGENKTRKFFGSWFTPPQPEGEIIDKLELSHEGEFGKAFYCYAAFSDGRLQFLSHYKNHIKELLDVLLGMAVGVIVGLMSLGVLGMNNWYSMQKAQNEKAVPPDY